MKYHLVEGEDASTHWCFLDVKDQVVLDLGCGIWYTTEVNEFTPIYFRNNGASKVIGIDGDATSIQYFNELCADDPAYVFIAENLQTRTRFIELVQTYNPTVVKIDIEGSEELLRDVTLSELGSIHEMAIEYHSLELKMMLYDKFNEWGFKIKSDVFLGNAFQNHFNGVLHYHR